MIGIVLSCIFIFLHSFLLLLCDFPCCSTFSNTEAPEETVPQGSLCFCYWIATVTGLLVRNFLLWMCDLVHLMGKALLVRFMALAQHIFPLHCWRRAACAGAQWQGTDQRPAGGGCGTPDLLTQLVHLHNNTIVLPKI